MHCTSAQNLRGTNLKTFAKLLDTKSSDGIALIYDRSLECTAGNFISNITIEHKLTPREVNKNNIKIFNNIC